MWNGDGGWIRTSSTTCVYYGALKPHAMYKVEKCLKRKFLIAKQKKKPKKVIAATGGEQQHVFGRMSVIGAVLRLSYV